MIVLIAGSSHAGKTVLAQKLLEKYHYPYLSIDHLKMGLIRSGQTALTVEQDEELTQYLWPIVREMIKTAIENRQNLIVEGCYIPFDWQKDFEPEYLKEIRHCCLVMSEHYVRTHFADIRAHACDIEDRGDDDYCTLEQMLRENGRTLQLCRQFGCSYTLIDTEYSVDLDLEKMGE